MFLRHATTPPRRIFKSKWLLRLLVATFSLAFGLVVSEVALRLAGVSNPQMYEPDEHCASRLMPGFRGYSSKEGAAHVEVNRFGFRDREWSIEKPAGTFRIAVIGDSYIEAAQVEREDMFGVVLERELNQSRATPQPVVEVLNFGVSGWGTAQALQALTHHVWQFSPDLVLLAFTLGNDVRNNSRRLEPTDCRPFFDLVDGELKLDTAFRQHPSYLYGLRPTTRTKAQIINSSRLLQVVQRVRQGWAERAKPMMRLQGQELGLDDEVFRAPTSPEWKEAWELTDRLMLEMHREVTARGKQFVVMTVTSGVQVHRDQVVRDAAAKRLGVEDLLYPDRHLGALAETAGFKAILLGEPLGAWAIEHNEFVHGFHNTAPGSGHWNVAGHREAARIVAAALRDQVR